MRNCQVSSTGAPQYLRNILKISSATLVAAEVMSWSSELRARTRSRSCWMRDLVSSRVRRFLRWYQVYYSTRTRQSSRSYPRRSWHYFCCYQRRRRHLQYVPKILRRTGWTNLAIPRSCLLFQLSFWINTGRRNGEQSIYWMFSLFPLSWLSSLDDC